ncbi:hypothetical protein, partial [Thiolapillus sp.]|uniref:hypothetical protein n=2 Tax=Thiolapillus sp. TaxID=2017437 RepID=UPI003AF5681D
MKKACKRNCNDLEFQRRKTTKNLKKFGSSAEFVGSRGGFEANDQVCPVGVEHPTRSLRRWSCETIINSEGSKWDAAQDYPEPGAEIQVI